MHTVAGMLTNPAGLNPLTERIIGAAMDVHRAFGPGLLESVYADCLRIEFGACGLRIEEGRRIPLTYRGVRLKSDFVSDLIVEDLVVVEIKVVSTLAPVHRSQVMTYLKLTGCPVGLLMNFNVPVLKDGIRRITNAAGLV